MKDLCIVMGLCLDPGSTSISSTSVLPLDTGNPSEVGSGLNSTWTFNHSRLLAPLAVLTHTTFHCFSETFKEI